MNITIKEILVQDSTIDTALEILIDVEYLYQHELPISISGKLSLNRKTIAIFNEASVTNNNTLSVQLSNQQQKNQMLAHGTRINSHSSRLTAFLSSKAIDFIEETRQKTSNKSVIFDCEFTVKYLGLPTLPENRTELHLMDIRLDLTPKVFLLNYLISHSDWVDKFAQKLGIGNFILLEYRIPDKQSVIADWEELYERLYERTQEMEEAIRKGEWKLVMTTARQFFENVKIGDGKPNHKPLEDELKTIFLKENHTEEGFKHLMNGIYNFFEFLSKYIHDKDKVTKIQPIPNYTKEDSYFIYSLSVGLLNMIGKKISIKSP